MATLKEIKERIASVGSTLKITSAMKMVSSAKLHKAQRAIGNLGPYQATLSSMLLALLPGDEKSRSASPLAAYATPREEIRRVALVAVASNQSLCGAFNSNVIREASAAIRAYRAAGVEVTVFSVGRKMADAMRRLGFPSPEDYSALSAKPSYEGALGLGKCLVEGYLQGRYDRIELIFNHFASAASQPTWRQTYLPMTYSSSGSSPDYILEPGRDALVEDLLPKVLDLRIYTTLLDAAAAEHAARTVAMQMATDNGNELLQALTLEYNKSRQQKITAEILDLVGGALQ